MSSNITPGHVRAYQAVTSGIYGETSLFNCTINGKPGVALVLMHRPDPDHVAVMPLFVAITDDMDIVFEGERSGGGGGGGPTDPREQFEAAAQDVAVPAPS